MAQEIEIEFKNLLTKSQFDRLLQELPFQQPPRKQTNYYFETKANSLQKQRCALRIRTFNDSFYLTFKEPYKKGGLLETHDELTQEEAERWINHKPFKTQHVYNQLVKRKIPLADLRYVGKLFTKRYTYNYEEGVIVFLDQSHYQGQTDYELEVEALNEAQGQKVFEDLLNHFHIAKCDTKPKIARFFAASIKK